MANQPTPFQFGPFLLQSTPAGSNLRFRTNHQVSPHQQCLLDNLWNCRKMKNFHDIVECLAGHFAFINSHSNLQQHNFSHLSLRPNSQNSPSSTDNQLLRVSLSLAEQRIHEQKDIISDLEKIASHAKMEMLNAQENWQIFPPKIEAVKATILAKVLAREITTFSKYQHIFRQIAMSDSEGCYSLRGTQLQCITYRENSQLQFSYILLQIDASRWRDTTIDSIELNISHLLSLGFISCLLFTKASQIRVIKTASIADGIFQLLEKIPKGGAVEVSIRAVPPCLDANCLENTKLEVLLRSRKEKPLFLREYMSPDNFVSEQVCSLPRQVTAYRAYVKAYEEELPFGDIGILTHESFDLRLYIHQDEALDLQLRPLSFKNPDSKLSHYFYKNRAKHFISEFPDTTETTPRSLPNPPCTDTIMN